MEQKLKFQVHFAKFLKPFTYPNNNYSPLHTLLNFLPLLKLSLPSGSAGLPMQEDARETGLNPKWGRFPGEGNCNPLQYFCLENSTERGAWGASPWGCRESDTMEHACTPTSHILLKFLSLHKVQIYTQTYQGTIIFCYILINISDFSKHVHLTTW